MIYGGLEKFWKHGEIDGSTELKHLDSFQIPSEGRGKVFLAEGILGTMRVAMIV